jgi:hypothetical protein
MKAGPWVRGGRLVLLLLWYLHPAQCLAVPTPSSSSSSNSPPGSLPNTNSNSKLQEVVAGGASLIPKQLRSIQKNGGHSQIFSFDHDDNDTICATTKSIMGSDTQRIQQQQPPPKRRRTVQSILPAIQSALRSTFLPSGYPTKTPDGYLRYSVWSWIQDVSTQLRSVLATQRVLEGVGVGREGATALSALMNFLVRDGCGMAASLLFTSVRSSHFRTDVKRWRLFADMMVDLGITLEVAAIVVPRVLFLPMISVGNMCKAICGVAAGACGGSINLHWARGSDISDINAKFGAQHTVTGALGLVFAAFFAKSVSHVQPLHLWLLYSTLTVLHIYANTRCMRLIAFDSLNNWRFDRLLSEFFVQGWEDATEEQNKMSPAASTTTTEIQKDDIVVLSSPAAVAQIEPLFFGLPNGRRRLLHSLSHKVPIYFGASFNQFSEQTTHKGTKDLWRDAERMMNGPSEDLYLISSGWLPPRGKYKNERRQPCVSVVFGTGTIPLEEAKAYVHAQLLCRRLEEEMTKSSSSTASVDQNDDSQAATLAAHAESKACSDMTVAWDMFQASCQARGWDLSKTELRTLGYEVESIATS